MDFVSDATRAENALSQSAMSMGALSLTRSSTSSITGGLKQIGLISDEQQKSLRVINGALNVITGTAVFLMAYQSFLSAYRTRETIKASAETTAHAIAQNWVGIGIATATALSVVTIIVSAQALSNPVLRGDLMSSLRGVIHGG